MPSLNFILYFAVFAALGVASSGANLQVVRMSDKEIAGIVEDSFFQQVKTQGAKLKTNIIDGVEVVAEQAVVSEDKDPGNTSRNQVNIDLVGSTPDKKQEYVSGSAKKVFDQAKDKAQGYADKLMNPKFWAELTGDFKNIPEEAKKELESWSKEFQTQVKILQTDFAEGGAIAATCGAMERVMNDVRDKLARILVKTTRERRQKHITNNVPGFLKMTGRGIYRATTGTDNTIHWLRRIKAYNKESKNIKELGETLVHQWKIESSKFEFIVADLAVNRLTKKFFIACFLLHGGKLNLPPRMANRSAARA